MLFTSLEFLLLFFPIVVIVNFLLPRKFRNIWLFIASIFFYAWGEPTFVLIMLASIVINYLLALLIEKNRDDNKIKKTILVIDLICNLGILFVYKYMNFATTIIHHFHENTVITNFILPIGISFYTFQAISYVVDVYRGEKAQHNIFYVGLYISFFPQLIAGPIVRYSDIKEQIKERTTSFEKFSDGILRFMIGFNKKMLFANILATVADQAFSVNKHSVLMAWLGAICYSLQIYYDFIGYSDMAIGLAKLFGFDLLENFNYPYVSKTISEFWRRWHISLGNWFRDYVYFPLGGSRVSSKQRVVFNLMVVWLLTGIWHGANFTFIIWGIIYGILISFEKTFDISKKLSTNKGLSIIYRIFTMLAVIIGWVLFRSDSIHYAIRYITDMFGLRQGGLFDAAAIFYLREYAVFIVLGGIFSLPIIKKFETTLNNLSDTAKATIDVLVFTASIILFLVGVSYLVISAHNPFIYFNF